MNQKNRVEIRGNFIKIQNIAKTISNSMIGLSLKYKEKIKSNNFTKII